MGEDAAHDGGEGAEPLQRVVLQQRPGPGVCVGGRGGLAGTDGDLQGERGQRALGRG